MADEIGRQFVAHATRPLVGREREQAALREALAAAIAGQGGLVLIGGEAGIGKTTLAEALGREAAGRGAQVLVGRCYDLSETPPYGPWREVLARSPRDDGLPPLPTATLPLDHDGDALTSQEAIFARVGAYFTALATRQPLAVLLEDVHWADPTSFDLLRALARGLARLPILILATYRADALTRRHPLYGLLPVLEREAQAQRLDLRPLGEVALRDLVADRYALPDPDAARLVAWLLGRAEGNAFFTAQLLRALEDEGVLRPISEAWALGDLAGVGLPLPLRQVLDARLARLAGEHLRLLTLAAVIGQEVPLALWAAVAGTDEDGLLETVELGVEARLLEALAAGDAVRFAHALIREALYEGMLPMRRRRVHLQTGEALAATPQTDPDAVAYHFRAAGDARAAGWLVRAGERAQRAYAWLTAAARYEAALALLERQGADAGVRGWVAFHLALTRSPTYDRRAMAGAEEAARLAGEAGDRLLAGLATYLAGLAHYNHGYPLHGLPQMAVGLDALDALPPAERVPPGATAPFDPAPRRGTLVVWLANFGRYAEALAAGERYLATTPPLTANDWLGGNPYADAHEGLGVAYAGLGQPERARAALARARELHRAVGHHTGVANLTMNELQLVLPYLADEPAELRRLAGEAEAAYGQMSGSMLAPFPVRVAWLPVLVLAGEWREARALMERAIGTGVEGRATRRLAQLARELGDPALAWARLRGWLPEGPQTAPGQVYPIQALPLLRLAVALALDAGDLPAARSWLAAHDRWLAWSGAVPGQADGQLAWAAYHRAAGDLVTAHQHAAQALALAADPRQPLALLAAHRFLGELAMTDARTAEAEAHLAEALALAEACAAPYERALTLLALAELRAADALPDDARVSLAEARAILEPLGARPALARADSVAARLAAAPAAPRPDGLSRREAEVLRLLATGRSNGQVAQTLSVSPRTVKRHIANAYGKIGAHNRAEATAYALRHGLA